MNNVKKGSVKFYKYIALAGMFLLSARIIAAQPDSTKVKELSFYLKGAFTGLDFEMNGEGSKNNRYGTGIGLQYAHYLDQRWSVSAGLEYQSYRSEGVLAIFSDQYTLTDSEGDEMEFQASATTYSEKQWVGMLNIPVKVQYETRGAVTRLYASAGVQLGIPLTAKYQSNITKLETAGYYAQWDAELEDPAFLGFGSWGDMERAKQELDIKSSYSLLLELGVKFNMKTKQHLYVGTFAGLGLNSLNKRSGDSTALIAYDVDDPTNFGFNSMFTSSPGGAGSYYADKLKIQSFGVKIRYAFDLK